LGIVVATAVGAAGAARAGLELTAATSNDRRIGQQRANKASMVRDLNAVTRHDNVIIGRDLYDACIFLIVFRVQTGLPSGALVISEGAQPAVATIGPLQPLL
jgi:hypothetical protein